MKRVIVIWEQHGVFVLLILGMIAAVIAVFAIADRLGVHITRERVEACDAACIRQIIRDELKGVVAQTGNTPSQQPDPPQGGSGGSGSGGEGRPGTGGRPGILDPVLPPGVECHINLLGQQICNQ